MKIVIVLFLLFILGSLGSALYFLVRDKGHSERTVRARASPLVPSSANES